MDNLEGSGGGSGHWDALDCVAKTAARGQRLQNGLILRGGDKWTDGDAAFRQNFQTTRYLPDLRTVLP